MCLTTQFVALFYNISQLNIWYKLNVNIDLPLFIKTTISLFFSYTFYSQDSMLFSLITTNLLYKFTLIVGLKLTFGIV